MGRPASNRLLVAQAGARPVNSVGRARTCLPSPRLAGPPGPLGDTAGSGGERGPPPPSTVTDCTGRPPANPPHRQTGSAVSLRLPWSETKQAWHAHATFDVPAGEVVERTSGLTLGVDCDPITSPGPWCPPTATRCAGAGSTSTWAVPPPPTPTRSGGLSPSWSISHAATAPRSLGRSSTSPASEPRCATSTVVSPVCCQRSLTTSSPRSSPAVAPERVSCAAPSTRHGPLT